MFNKFDTEIKKIMLEVRIANLEGRHGRENQKVIAKLRRRLRALGE